MKGSTLTTEYIFSNLSEFHFHLTCLAQTMIISVAPGCSDFR